MSARSSRFLAVLCAVVTALLLAAFVCSFGLGGRPAFGFWDAITVPSGLPFVAEIEQTTHGGAAEAAGIRDGDRVDLRGLSPYERVALLYQPVTAKPLLLNVRRGDKSIPIRFKASTQYEGGALLKTSNNILWMLADFFALGCAWLLAFRRAQTREGRYLCLTLLAIVAGCVGPSNIALPNGTAGAFSEFLQGLTVFASALLPLHLSAQFGMRTRARTIIEIGAWVAASVSLSGYAACALGMYNASIDPLPFAYDVFWRAMSIAIFVLPLTAAALATAATQSRERVRTAWLLLPLPTSLLLYSIAAALQGSAPSWQSYMAYGVLANILLLMGSAAVTYALLKRRVLDLQFVIGRTLVVGGVSAIVLVSFVLLEWLLGAALTNASHATGLAANAALALVLGLSMQMIHKRVDAAVDFIFFHKRHEAEQALRAFAKEAAFVTRKDDLLGLTVDVMRAHTDARSASILLDDNGLYRSVRWFGDSHPDAGENDPAILALKATHRPVDPHRYNGALRGDLALPMLARGRVLGVLVCGARSGGEAYAPDDVSALTELAQGVGSALDSLERSSDSRDDAILSELRALRDALTGPVRNLDPEV